jgi:hypothetical protein
VLSAQKFRVRNKTPVVPQPPYSPDLSPALHLPVSKVEGEFKRTLISISKGNTYNKTY